MRAAPRRLRAASAHRTAHRSTSSCRSRLLARTARRIEWRAEDIADRPSSPGSGCSHDVPLATLRDYIDWTPFFHTWELKGVYPRILENDKYGEQARTIFAEANLLLDKIVAHKLLRARGVYGLFPANAVGDDVELYADASRSKLRSRFHFLRQQLESEGEGRAAPIASADFIAPKDTGLADHIGAFAVSTGFGLKELCDGFRAKQDDYNAIMAEAIADRLAEAFAECLHERVRKEWGYGKSEALVAAELIAGEYRGIRPAAGYPACPDHTEKGVLWISSTSRRIPACSSRSRSPCGPGRA